MKKIKGAIVWLHYMRHNSVVIDTTHSLKIFNHLTMQITSASSGEKLKTPIHSQRWQIDNSPDDDKNNAFDDHSSEWETAGTMTPPKTITETANLLISHSKSTTIDMKVAARVTNTAESTYTIRKNTQIAEFFVVTPEQSNVQWISGHGNSQHEPLRWNRPDNKPEQAT